MAKMKPAAPKPAPQLPAIIGQQEICSLARRLLFRARYNPSLVARIDEWAVAAVNAGRHGPTGEEFFRRVSFAADGAVDELNAAILLALLKPPEEKP